MTTSFFLGQLVRLAAVEPTDHATIARWTDNFEYMRLVDTAPPRPQAISQISGQYTASNEPTSYFFTLRTLSDDRLIGFVVLHSIEWSHGIATLSIGIGESEDWGKGYGVDALQLILRYGFDELNLHRVGLDVIATNTRALRAYEKVGFRLEGTVREAVHRDRQRTDRLYMGILRREWEALNG